MSRTQIRHPGTETIVHIDGTEFRLQKEDLVIDYPGQSNPTHMLREMQGFKQSVPFIRVFLGLLKTPLRAGTRSPSFPILVRYFSRPDCHTPDCTGADLQQQRGRYFVFRALHGEIRALPWDGDRKGHFLRLVTIEEDLDDLAHM